MDVIRANCPECGDVKLFAPDVTLRVCKADGSTAYWFRCPLCAVRVARDANPRVFDLLHAVGVPIVTWDLPDEMNEPRQGSPITPDDVLDFHLMLSRTDWFDRLVATIDETLPGGQIPRH